LGEAAGSTAAAAVAAQKSEVRRRRVECVISLGKFRSALIAKMVAKLAQGADSEKDFSFRLTNPRPSARPQRVAESGR
jgi:threonine dehydratase